MWLDNLRPASFRGEPFFVETSKRSLGRRVVVHEFPNRETPYTQDMGRISDSFEIEGHVVGNDYDEAKERLEKVFNKYGPGDLVHPYYGLRRVQVGAVEFSESTKEGAILYFTATFKEAGNNKFPDAINDKAAILDSAVGRAIKSIQEQFNKLYSITALPGFAIESAREAIATAQKSYAAATKGVADISDQATQLAFSTRNLVAETNDLLKSPSSLSQRLLSSFNLLESAISSSRLRTDALISFFGFGSSAPSVQPTTPVRAREAQNQQAFNNFMKSVAVVKSAQAAQASTFDSFQEAEVIRDKIVAVIEEQIRTTTDSELYQALIDVKAALVDALPDVDADLPNLKEVTVKASTTSLHLAYDLFQDPRSESDIIKRNHIKNPALIPSGTVLEVLDGNV